MADGRRRDEWDRTSHVLATLINANQGRKGRTVRPDELNPFARRHRSPTMKVKMQNLKGMFVSAGFQERGVTG